MIDNRERKKETLLGFVEPRLVKRDLRTSAFIRAAELLRRCRHWAFSQLAGPGRLCISLKHGTYVANPGATHVLTIIVTHVLTNV